MAEEGGGVERVISANKIERAFHLDNGAEASQPHCSIIVIIIINLVIIFDLLIQAAYWIPSRSSSVWRSLGRDWISRN